MEETNAEIDEEVNDKLDKVTHCKVLECLSVCFPWFRMNNSLNHKCIAFEFWIMKRWEQLCTGNI